MAVDTAPARAAAPGLAPARAPRLPLLTKVAFGFGDSGMSATSTIINLFFLFYLTEVAGLRPALAGAAILAGRFYDAVTDPLEGYLSDRTRSRWGRRRPYFLFGAVPFGLSFALLFLVPSAAGQGWKSAYAAFAYILHMTAFTGIGVPYTALTAELTHDYDERTSLTAYRMAFSILFGLVAAAVPLMIVGAFPGSSRTGYAVMAAAFGAFTVLPPLTVFFGCREPKAALSRATAPEPAAATGAAPTGAAPTGAAGEAPTGAAPTGTAGEASVGGATALTSAGRPAAGFRDFLREMLLTLRNRPFRVALLVFVLTWMGMDIITSVFLYFLRYVMGMEGSAEAIFGILFTVAALCLPLWVWVSERWSKKVAYLAGISFLAAVLSIVAFLRQGMTTAVYVLVALAGVGVSTAHVIPWSMIPDCIEYDELRTGRRREGQHYGFMTFAQKAASSGAIFLTGLALEASGYVAGAVQPASALTVIRVLLGPVPAAVFILGMVVLAFYPVTRAGHARVRAELEARRRLLSSPSANGGRPVGQPEAPGEGSSRGGATRCPSM